MIIAGQNTNDEKRLINVLTADYEGLYYYPLDGDDSCAELIEYRSSPELTEIITELFGDNDERIKTGYFDNIVIYEEDRNKLWEETRYPVVMEKLTENPIYYVFFRAYLNKTLRYYKLKFVLDYKNNNPVGAVLAIIGNDLVERSRQQQQLEYFHTIDNAERIIMERTAELRDRTLALSFANGEVIELLGNIVELRNRESGLHIKRVKSFTRVLANQVMAHCPEYGLNDELVECIVSASSLHDVGKIMIPDAILLKEARLTPDEIKTMQKHCEYGLEILRSAPQSWTAQFTKTALDICYCHHEKWDGKGYPCGLKGNEIPIAAQIVSIADCYDALTTERVYKPAYSPDESYRMIVNGECGAFSDKILACLAVCKDRFAEIVADPKSFHERNTIQISGDNKLNGLKILLVDDSDISIEINRDILESEGAIITTAENGVQAIEKFSNEGPFDAIIMDVVMPEIDGIEATKRIRAIEGDNSNRIPIIALTAEGSAYNTLLDAGIDASMAKPLVVGEFTRILISCMHNSSLQMQKQLLATLQIANTDTLTKVKNIAAYTDMLASLNNDIKRKNKPVFAIVVCDINNLKRVNDTFGHETGNIYIKNCCSLLCSVYNHSPVYRVGGDEFVVVLQDSDYAAREEKLQILRERVAEAETIEEYIDGKASFAIGMADYNPLEDNEVSEVQDRADAMMYMDKGDRRRD